MAKIVEPVARFFRQSLYSFKALFGWIDPKIYILAKVVTPICQLLFFGLMARYVHGASDITPWIIGNSILLCTYNSIFGLGNVISKERYLGTLKVVMVTPSNKFLVFFGRAFMHILDALSSVLFGLFIGILLFRINLSNIHFTTFFLGIILALFSASGFGLLIGSLGLRIRDMNMVMNLSAMGLLALTGANYPIEKLPSLLQRVSYCLPITRIIQAMHAMLEGENQYIIIHSFLKEFLIGVIYLLFGYLLLRIMEKQSIKTAQLDFY